MPIEFRCPSCTQQLRVPDTAAGKGAKCPKCQSIVTVPAASEQPGGASSLPSFGNAPASPPPFNPPPLTPPPFLAPPASSTGSPFGAPPASKPADPFGGFSPGGKPAASSNPFGDFASGGGGGGSGSGNPFATSGPSPFGGSPNPYAATAPVGGFGSQQLGVERSGLPWEVEGASPSSWFSTLQAVLGDPNNAFRRMRLTGGIGQPMLFNVIGTAIGVIVPTLMQLGQIFLIPQRGNNMEPAMAAGVIVGIVALQVLLGATLGLLIGAGIVHLCLMLWGGAKEDYEATLRVLGYAQGSANALQLIPCLGPCVAVIWVLVVQIVGLAEVHRTDVWRVVLAIFTPLLVCGGLFLIIFLALIGIAAAR